MIEMASFKLIEIAKRIDGFENFQSTWFLRLLATFSHMSRLCLHGSSFVSYIPANSKG